MKEACRAYRVFISHASADVWIAREFAEKIRGLGAEPFLDYDEIHAGDRFEDKLLHNVRLSDELLVLLTPKALERKYIWLEIGAVWAQGKRIVVILYGVTDRDLEKKNVPLLLKATQRLEINTFDTYLRELYQRIAVASNTRASRNEPSSLASTWKGNIVCPA